MSEETTGAAMDTEAEQNTATEESKASQEQNSGKKADKGEGQTITIAYNHEQIPLTYEEAVRLAQSGNGLRARRRCFKTRKPSLNVRVLRPWRNSSANARKT